MAAAALKPDDIQDFLVVALSVTISAARKCSDLKTGKRGLCASTPSFESLRLLMTSHACCWHGLTGKNSAS